MSDAELFRRFRDALSTNADVASETVTKLLDAVWGLSDAEAYEYVLANYPKLMQAYGRVAAEAARQYYQEERDNADLEQGYTATSAGAGDESWYAQDVGEAYGRARPTGDHPLMSPLGLPNRAVKRTMERADRTIVENARRDPARPKWAFVAGPGACGFCVMVSSNGWTLSEKGARARRHDHCKCTAAVSFDEEPQLDGYDPEAMQDAYSKAYDAAKDDIERKWSEMSAEERTRYKRKGRSDKDVYRTKRITEEMNRRNREWLQTGAPRFRTKELGAHPLKKERDVGTCMLMQGFDVRFIKEVNKTHVKTADAYLNGEVWEFKVPEGWQGEQTIRNQFFKAKDKGTDKLLISGTVNHAPLDEMTKWVIRIFEKGDYDYISEVLLLDASGENLVRLNR